MEGAGASIVRDAAELATRRMDSADEEPETSNVSETVEEPKLPSAVQDLLPRLEGASIVSDAAELATRRMDSADEEPETSNVSETVEEPETSNVSETVEEPETSNVSETDEGPESSDVSETDEEPDEGPETSDVSETDDGPENSNVTETDEEPENSNASETVEEPELPSAVQALLRRLEGKGEPLREPPNLHEPEFREFFPDSAALSTITGWRSQVRLRVLEAIGNCNTFQILNVPFIRGRDEYGWTRGDISRLTASEWEIVFRGFMSSTNLRTIDVGSIESSSDEEVESLCLHLGRILNSSSVIYLIIYACRLSARCWLNLASGLRGNCESKLQSLVLWNAWEDSSVVKHVAEMINSAPLLQTLILRESSKMDDEAVGMLSQALIQSSSLQELTIWEVEWEAALLLKALAGDDGNRSIERLILRNMDGRGDCLRQVLSSNPSLKDVDLRWLRMRPEEWQQLGEGIRDNATATNINVEFLRGEDEEDDDWKSIEALAGAASSDVKDPIVELSLFPDSDHNYLLSLNLLGRVLRGELKSLKSFHITRKDEYSGSNEDGLEGILSMNGNTGETSVLKKLTLDHVQKDVLKDLLRCLRGNTSLTHLSLSYSNIEEEAFRDLMGILQVNLTLQEINVQGTRWEYDGKAAQIEEALKQNQKRAVYMSVFREAKLSFGDAKASRLFLCGSPLAGKTQVRQTLMRIVKGRSWIGNKLKELWRTQGIEVEFLQNDDKSQISIWDLAGQGIFRTLQNVIFPQSNNFCIFLFVYSPFRKEDSSEKDETCFETELEEWLSFITSGTRVTGHSLPQVLVVITHKDKVPYSSLEWAQDIVGRLTQRFANFVDLHQKVFYLNARKKKEVIPLQKHIFEILKNLLSEKSPQVPQLCSRLSSLLFTNTKKNRFSPLWSSKNFHEFCADTMTEFIPSSSAHSVDRERIRSSIISYLNDVGSIISIPNLDYIIVDPNWLTYTVLGKLVSLGQNFRPQKFGSIESSPYISKDGFVSKIVFVRLMEEFRRRHPHGQGGVTTMMLEDILINLDLCFKVEDPPRYFIPSFIPEHASTEKQTAENLAWETRDETSQFVGIRIECQDRITMSLTAAFFPCFQMFIRRKLISEKHVLKENVNCSRHYLQLSLNGYEIYVEQGLSHKYVDVLVLHSKHKSRSEAVQYVRKYIVEELISFCASSKGCPGVALVLGVIQTCCVEMLIPSDLRGAILVEELKSNYIRDINDKLEIISSESLHLVKEEELFNYEHSWHSIREHTLTKFEKARDLLWESDVEAVENKIRQKRMQQLESWEQSLIQELESLQQGLNEVNKDLIHSNPETENMVTNSNVPDVKDSNRPSSSSLSGESTSVEDCNFRLVLERIDGVGNKVDGVDERLRSVQSILQRLEMKILSLQQELQSTLSDFTSKVDRIVKYSHSLQLPSLPKRPYITDDVGVFHRMNAALNAGTTVRLHLMCESWTGFHKVKDQEGLKIRVDRYNSSWIGKTIEISYKVMYYATKAGLDVTLGLGQAIPDLADLRSNIVKLGGISDSDRRAVLKGGESMELKEAWRRIQQTLADINYSESFKLYQVKYVRQELGGHAWVCEECMNKGRLSGILTD
ncbi:hypothetical protein MPTK1_8g16169 [Marchantia polymorpha subsp. ruderalis]